MSINKIFTDQYALFNPSGMQQDIITCLIDDSHVETTCSWRELEKTSNDITTVVQS